MANSNTNFNLARDPVFDNPEVKGNTIIGDNLRDTLTVNATTTFNSAVTLAAITAASITTTGAITAGTTLAAGTSITAGTTITAGGNITTTGGDLTTTGGDLVLSRAAGIEAQLQINSANDSVARYISFRTGGTEDWAFGMPSGNSSLFLDNSNAGLNTDFVMDFGTGQLDLTSTNGIVMNKGTVTQITDINTGVTLNTPAGVITTVSAPTVAQDNDVFTVTNSVCTAASVVLVNIVDYAGTYSTNGLPTVNVDNIGLGSFDIVIMNAHDTNALSGILQIAFHII